MCVCVYNANTPFLCLFVDKHVISQESAKRALSVAVCDHYNFVRRCLYMYMYIYIYETVFGSILPLSICR